MALAADLRGFGELAIAESFELKHADLKAVNTRDRPDEVSPVKHGDCKVEGGELKATLKPLSWNVFALKAY
jgi:alpha-N-arabinofuranosidase